MGRRNANLQLVEQYSNDSSIYSVLPQAILPPYSQLSPFGYLAMTDTPIIQIAAKFKAKIIYRRLTEINSRYYGLSVMRTLTRGPNSVRHKGI